jgi:hypothetical protein
MSITLSTGGKDFKGVNYVIAHIATGRISRSMQKVMKSSMQVICVKYVTNPFPLQFYYWKHISSTHVIAESNI